MLASHCLANMTAFPRAPGGSPGNPELSTDARLLEVNLSFLPGNPGDDGREQHDENERSSCGG